MMTLMTKQPVTMRSIEHLLVSPLSPTGSDSSKVGSERAGGQGCEQQWATVCDFARWASSFRIMVTWTKACDIGELMCVLARVSSQQG